MQVLVIDFVGNFRDDRSLGELLGVCSVDMGQALEREVLHRFAAVFEVVDQFGVEMPGDEDVG